MWVPCNSCWPPLQIDGRTVGPRRQHYNSRRSAVARCTCDNSTLITISFTVIDLYYVIDTGMAGDDQRDVPGCCRQKTSVRDYKHRTSEQWGTAKPADLCGAQHAIIFPLIGQCIGRLTRAIRFLGSKWYLLITYALFPPRMLLTYALFTVK